MTPKFWKKFVTKFETTPSVNQIEFHPFNLQKQIRKLMDADGVKLEAWAPLFQPNPKLMNNEIINAIAEKYNKNPGLVILRFEIQEGAIIFPKTVSKERMKSNMDTLEDMEKIRSIDEEKGRCS